MTDVDGHGSIKAVCLTISSLASCDSDKNLSNFKVAMDCIMRWYWAHFWQIFCEV